MRETIPTSDEIEAMTARQYQVYENSLRRAARRQGLRLVRSRRRDPRALDYGLYVLVDDSAGNQRPGAQAPISAFTGEEGMSLGEAHAVLLKGR